MKLIQEHIAMECISGKPIGFTWRKRRYTVQEIIEVWTYRSAWWADTEDIRTYLSLHTQEGIVEVYVTPSEPQSTWVLSRVAD